ncbi:DUF116 domain-containing protein [Desulfovibrio sp. 86]|jgi:hypothetical protein|uniref:DUF116 domain-containing protein n=1 Tax=uncultured Desulfovibrio sp. TaxID=167968 RepID=A0A212L5J2_9BACT|nr:DUF116 domain-containing protein [Desulfovibrio sp. 86]SCM72790.1 conserved hypothetical protein [uncultured Desulfovibrio sp.]VZH33743.1 conserved protein of unknown function [Desulfovibrio sp. 86]
MKLRKSPFSLPPDQYGGARKRTFIGLMLASCVVLCLGLAIFLILPWSDALNGVVWLERLSIIVGLVCIIALMWLCLMLVFHIYTGKALPGAGSVRHVTVRLFFPLMELLAKFVGIDRGSVRRSFIKVNNELVLSRRKTVEPHKLLLLLPHCVQRSACPHRLVHNADLCLRCGGCPVGDLLDLRDKYGIRFAIATGGTIARRIVVQTRPDCIIAVACERDLTSGIQDSYPLPVFGVLNSRPKGPCLDTLVPMDALEDVIRLFLGLSDSLTPQPLLLWKR